MELRLSDDDSGDLKALVDAHILESVELDRALNDILDVTSEVGAALSLDCLVTDELVTYSDALQGASKCGVKEIEILLAHEDLCQELSEVDLEGAAEVLHDWQSDLELFGSSLGLKTTDDID